MEVDPDSADNVYFDGDVDDVEDVQRGDDVDEAHANEDERDD